MTDGLRNAWLAVLLALVLAVIVGPREGGLAWLAAVYLIGGNVVLLSVLRRRS